MTRFALIFLSVFVYGMVQAQEPVYLDMAKSESLLHSLFEHLYSDSLADPEPVLKTIQEIMPKALSSEGAMEFPWSGLNRIGVVASEDGAIRIFTWHVMDDSDHYRYFGYIQVAIKKGKVEVFTLIDNGKSQRRVTKLDQKLDDWYGKLYYGIITNSFKRKIYYTLLGMDFNDSRSTFKTIETINIQRNQPRFLKGHFLDGRDRQDRLVLEYSAQVAISVRYDPGMHMITFDHLTPFHPIYENNFEFYGPDGSYDGLEFIDETWILREDIDARNVN